MCGAADIGLLALVLRNAVYIYFCLSLARTIRIEVSEKRRKFLGAPLPRPHTSRNPLSRVPLPQTPPPPLDPFHRYPLHSCVCVCVWCICLPFCHPAPLLQSLFVCSEKEAYTVGFGVASSVWFLGVSFQCGSSSMWSGEGMPPGGRGNE